MEETKIKGIKITYTEDYMTFKDSFQISNIDKMKIILKEALEKTTIYTTKRNINSLIDEWIAHNILYKLHLFRKHTQNSNFKKKIKKRVALCYFLLSVPFKIKHGYSKFFKELKIKRKEKQYKKYIQHHLKNIQIAYQEEIVNNPNTYLLIDKELLKKLYKRVLTHDKSKYSMEEFNAYRKNFYPINNKEKEENKKDFEKAWEHHWNNNSHHWEYRQNKQYFNINNDEEVLDVLENILDWIAMGYKFKDRPTDYYEKNKDKIILCDKERAYLEHVLYDIIQKDGGKTWKKIAKKKNKKKKLQ